MLFSKHVPPSKSFPQWCIVFICISVLIITLACASLFTVPTTTQLQVDPIPLPLDDYGPVAWFEDWIVIETTSINGNWNLYTSRLWKAKIDGSNFEMLDFPNRPDCGGDGVSGFEQPSRLPDDRLGFFIRCRTKLFMMAYDLNTGKHEQLLKYGFPEFGILRVDFSWNPEMNEGLAFADNRLQSWAVKYSLDTWEPLDLGFPQIRGLVWAADGIQIALMAAPELGLEGMNKADALFNLYLLNPDNAETRPILKNLYDPINLIWSPDSQWLAFFASIRNKRGLWLFNPVADKLELVSNDKAGWITWSPDGNEIMLVKRAKDSEQLEIIKIDISPLLAR